MQYGKIVHVFNHKGKEVVLRYPRIEDTSGLLSSINSLISEKAFILYRKKKTQKEELEWLLEKIKNIEEKKEVFLVIELDKKIVGSCGVEKRKEKQDYIGDFGIILKKEARNVGLGQKIIPLIVREAKVKLRVKTFILEVVKKNTQALHVYEKMGFQKTGELKKGINHFGKYFDLISMVKYL